MNGGSNGGTTLGGDSPNPLSGSLRTKISLRPPTPMPFHTMKAQLPPPSPLLGSVDLLAAYDLATAYQRFCSPAGARKITREDLNSFLPHLYGNISVENGQEISWLKMLVEKPPITGKEIGMIPHGNFKLAPGPVDEKTRALFERPREEEEGGSGPNKRKRKFKQSLEPISEDGVMYVEAPSVAPSPAGGPLSVPPQTPEQLPDTNNKKKHKDEKEKKAKKKKKEKKNKKEKDDKL